MNAAGKEQRFRAAERTLWSSLGLAPTERFVRLRTGEGMRVQEVGEGPPLIYVHGGANGGASWSPLIAHLEGFRHVALDRPGCGLSDPTHTSGSDLDALGTFADGFLNDVFDALDLASGSVISTSFGGYFAFRGAAAYPDRIDHIVELGWPIGAPMTKVPLAMRFGAVPGMGAVMARIPPTRGAVTMVLRQIGLRGALESGRFTEEMFDWFHSLLRDTASVANEQRASPRLITPIRGLNDRVLLPEALLSRLSMPVLFLWGTDDPNGGAEVATRFVAPFPNADLQLIAGAGHAPWIDDPQGCARAIAAFVS